MEKLCPIILNQFTETCESQNLIKTITVRFKNWEQIPIVGIQKWIDDLKQSFNDYFFDRSLYQILDEYEEYNCLSHKAYLNIEELHRLQYLPLEIRTVSEGIFISDNTPIIEIKATDSKYNWLVHCIDYSQLWSILVSAKITFDYRQRIGEYYNRTCDYPKKVNTALIGVTTNTSFSYDFITNALLGYLTNFYLVSHPSALSVVHKIYEDDIQTVGNNIIKLDLNSIQNDSTLSGIFEHPDSETYWEIIQKEFPKLKLDTRLNCIYVKSNPKDSIEGFLMTVLKLWNIVGGSTNTLGFKVFRSSVKVVYTNVLTIEECAHLYNNLQLMGFSAENIVIEYNPKNMLVIIGKLLSEHVLSFIENLNTEHQINSAPYFLKEQLISTISFTKIRNRIWNNSF